MKEKENWTDNIEAGDVISSKEGKYTRKILGICGEVVYLSLASEHDVYGSTITKKSLAKWYKPTLHGTRELKIGVSQSPKEMYDNFVNFYVHQLGIKDEISIILMHPKMWTTLKKVQFKSFTEDSYENKDYCGVRVITSNDLELYEIIIY